MNKNSFLCNLSESDKTKVGKIAFEEQPVPQKVFTAIWELEAEVNNGGFSQYFLNHSAESSGFVVEALKTVGAPQTARICERAIAMAFPTGLPSTPEKISEAAKAFSDNINEKLGELDGEFFTYPHDLTELLFAYAAAHPEEFGAVPSNL